MHRLLEESLSYGMKYFFKKKKKKITDSKRTKKKDARKEGRKEGRRGEGGGGMEREGRVEEKLRRE